MFCGTLSELLTTYAAMNFKGRPDCHSVDGLDACTPKTVKPLRRDSTVEAFSFFPFICRLLYHQKKASRTGAALPPPLPGDAYLTSWLAIAPPTVINDIVSVPTGYHD